MINGRISDQSYRGYKYAKHFIGPVLKKIDAFSMRTEEDAARIIHLGAPRERVQVTGNLKFDQKDDERSDEEITRLKQRYTFLKAKNPI